MYARVVELVDTYALGAYASRLAGSIPVSGTRLRQFRLFSLVGRLFVAELDSVLVKKREQVDQIRIAVAIAVDWWVEAVQNPAFDKNDSATVAFVESLGGASVLGHEFSKKGLKAFRKVLEQEILREMTENMRWSLEPICELYTTYGPACQPLSKAAQAAGVNEFSFPCKTNMSVSSHEIKVAQGYHAPSEIIWTLGPITR